MACLFRQLEIAGMASNVATYICCACVCKHTLFILSLLKDTGLYETSFDPLEVLIVATPGFLSLLKYNHKSTVNLALILTEIVNRLNMFEIIVLRTKYV